MRIKQLFFLAALVLIAAGPALADSITYDVTINTSSIAGTDGSLDFQFNPGELVTQAADLQILDFTSDGTLAGSPSLTGDVSGDLTSTVTFDNGTGYNDYFEGFTYGDTLSFGVSLYGPALASPDGTSTSGSSFAFSMFSDSAGTVPVLTSDLADGYALTIDVNLDGTATPTDLSAQLTASPLQTVTPEPGTVLLFGSGLIGLALLSRKFRFSH